MKKFLLYLLISLVLIPTLAFGKELKSIDAMVVIDNSASMKENDPSFLLKAALNIFIQNLQEDTYTGFILFSDKVDEFVPLNMVKSDSAKFNFEKILNSINYSGRFTNSPSAIEKAYYELKTNGRKESNKIIIFLTDGIVDLENKAKNDEKANWLKEVIANECKKENIKIFSIAFTEKADFELIQTLSSKTDGSYYRAINATDLTKVFDNISDELKKNIESPRNEVKAIVPASQPISTSIEAKSEDNYSFYIILTILLLFIIATVIFFYYQKRKSKPEFQRNDLPEAYLIDISGITNKGTFQVKKLITRIGRVAANDLCIPDENNFVSSLHAILEYKDNNFFVIDQDSVNGTYLNGIKIEKKEKVIIKGGDEIAFNKYAFKFLCPIEGERGQTVLNMGSSIGTQTIQDPSENTEKENDFNSKE